MAISTALPTIVNSLNGSGFLWVGSAHTLASAAVVPLARDLVSAFGCKPMLLLFITFLAVGSALCGAAQSMSLLIAGRGTFISYTIDCRI